VWASLNGSPARAQAVGGTVLPEIALSIGTPTALQAAGHDDYLLQVPVQVTSSVDQVRLSVADGEDPAGAAHGHLHDGAGVAAAPLFVSVGTGPTKSLAAPVDPLLKTWNGPVALAPATVVVRQRLAGSLRVATALHKLILISVSTETP